ncbi:MAG: DUF4115 domain-containing protein [Deltaproteobacteria bacterium]|nr:DUF4115 domain-containing protein [Deltaproteobacteria bacterium]
MENPGEYLKREREQRRVHLSKIAESTRVPLKFLEALEADDFETLPHPTFVKGYIKSYCKILGLDETDAVLRYELFLRERTDKTQEPEPAREEKKTPLGVFAAARKSERSPETRSGPFSARSVVIAAAVIAVVAVIYSITSKRPVKPVAEVKNTAPAAVAQNAKATEAPASSQGAAEKPADTAKPAAFGPSDKTEPAANVKHVLTASASEISWIKVSIDNEEPFDVVLRAGERVSWRADRVFNIVVGNAAGVSVNFDGEQMTNLGASGEVVKLTLPKDGEKARAKKAVKPKVKPSAASITPAGGIDVTTTVQPPKPAAKKARPAAVKPVEEKTDAPPAEAVNAADVKKPDDARPKDIEAPRWESKPKGKFEVRPVE